jgi:isopentenyl-diphosphate delta-isomerase
MDEAVRRRLLQELGLASDLQFLYKFQYQASYEDIGSENEICWVYIGITGDEARPNPNEVEDHRWVTSAELDEEMASGTEAFTPWFRMEWSRVRGLFRESLGL